jgi:hypothetical protein
MNRRTRRYLGMTSTQLSLLGGLAFLALIILCVLGWMVLGSSFSLPASQAPNTAAPTLPPTLTRTPKPPTPTKEPTPTLTPEPIETAIPLDGWVKFETKSLIDLWLPKNFVGGDMVTQKSASARKVDSLPKIFDNAAKEMRAAPKEVVLWMVDKTGTSAPITSVVVRRKVLADDADLKRFATDEVNGMNKQTPVITEQKSLTILGYEARRLVYQGYDVSVEFTAVFYAIKNGANFWTVEYRTAPGKYADLIPTIDTSIHTFYLLSK